VTERRHLREHLQCKSFEWYLHTVYPELRSLFYLKGFFCSTPNCFRVHPLISVPGRDHMGPLRHESLCLDTLGRQSTGQALELRPCMDTSDATTQDWTFHQRTRTVRYSDGHGAVFCLGVSGVDRPVLSECTRDTSGLEAWQRQDWSYDAELLTLKHQGRSLCLDGRSKDSPVLLPCTGMLSQRWTWGTA
jgi:hypothetical protein